MIILLLVFENTSLLVAQPSFENLMSNEGPELDYVKIQKIISSTNIKWDSKNSNLSLRDQSWSLKHQQKFSFKLLLCNSDMYLHREM